MAFADTNENLVKLAVAHLATIGYANVSVTENYDINGKYVTPPLADPNRHWYLSIAGTDCECVDEPGISVVFIHPKGEDDDEIDLQDFNHLDELLIANGYLAPRPNLEGGADVNVARSPSEAHHGKIKQTTFGYVGHGSPEPATLSEVAGVVILEMWGGDNVYTIQTIGGQNGQHDVSFVCSVVDNPIQQELISFEARGDAWETELRKVVAQLAHRLAHADVYDFQTRTRKPQRVISEDSERLIAEHVYKALLRASGYGCPECGAEDPRSGAPDGSVCRQVRTELVKEAELAAGWDASP